MPDRSGVARGTAIDLSGRAVVVTGAGAGLGRSYALLLAAKGACIVVNDLGCTPDGQGATTASATQVAEEIRRLGGQAVASHASVATRAGAKEIIATAMDTFGRIDGLVNNAGILRYGPLVEMQQEDVEQILDVHLKGTIYMTQAALPHLRVSGSGRLVHTTSGAGLFGHAGLSSYAAAKSGVVGFARSIAEETARDGILSNVVAPLAQTRLTDQVFPDAMRPETIAALIAYLVSDHCRISGEVFSAAAGRFARVFSGLTPGWQCYAGLATPEDVAHHLDEILSPEGYVIPRNAGQEVQAVTDSLASA